MKRNIKLLRKICERIEREPLRLEMEVFVNTLDSVAPCGTAACIAGHAVMIDAMEQDKCISWSEAGERSEFDDTARRARKLLGIDDGQARRLFFWDEWPEQFVKRFERLERAGGKRRRKAEAKVAVDRIRHFIETGE